MKRLQVTLSIIIIAGVVIWGVYRGGWFMEKPVTSPETKTGEDKEYVTEAGKETFIKRGLSIKAYKTSKTVFEDLLPAVGSIKGNVEVKLSMETQGIVETFNFREGEHIKTGEIIAQLVQKDALLKIDYTQKKLKAAMANLSSQEKKLKMFEKLYEIGAVNMLKLEEVKTETTMAYHQMETAQVELETAEYELAKTKLVAMRDGILGTKEVEPGELVTPYTKMATLMDVNYVNAEVGVVERDITKVKLGQIAKVYVDAYTDTSFEGIIDQLLPVIGEKTRTLTVRIRVDNTRGMLKPGMFVRGDIILYEKANVFKIPRVAMKKIDERIMVYVVDEETNTVKERLIKTDYASTDFAEVVAGLQEGELVAITDVEQLVDGTPVQITEIQVSEM
ncbi:MAG: efflux RND transporter periplasmic adaptor subunit [Candidatus Omnitrophota bacterium]